MAIQEKENLSFVRVWDLPLRVYHWSLAFCFLGAMLTKEGDDWREWHATFGYIMVGLVFFRIFWGLVGTHYAKFSHFFVSLPQLPKYLGQLFTGKTKRPIGHNPAGNAVYLTIFLWIFLLGVTGYFLFNEMPATDQYEHFLKEAHEFFGNSLLVLVFFHLVGVAWGSFQHKENLVFSMIHGKKMAKLENAVKNYWWGVIPILVLVALVFWYQAPTSAVPSKTKIERKENKESEQSEEKKEKENQDD